MASTTAPYPRPLLWQMPSVMLLLEFDARMLRWTGKRHGAFEFASVALVPIGCFVFFLYNYDSEEKMVVASMLDSRIGGILLVLVHVFSLAFTSTWQASLFERHRLSIWPMMLWTSAFALLFSVLASATEMADALESIGGFEGARQALPQIVATSFFFALGQFFALLIVQSYGALAIAAIMSVGQMGSGLTSIVVARQWPGSLQASCCEPSATGTAVSSPYCSSAACTGCGCVARRAYTHRALALQMAPAAHIRGWEEGRGRR